MVSSSTQIVCPACDLLLKKINITKGQISFCPRCNTTLQQKKDDSISKVLAISMTGLLVYIPAIFLPLLNLNTMGMEQSGSVFDAFLNFYDQQYYLVTVLLFLTTIFFPLLRLSILFSICLQLKISLYSRSLFFLFRTAHHLDEWGMSDVYMIALIISIIKIHKVATIEFDIGFFCFIFLVVMTRATTSVLEPEVFWQELETLKRNSARDSRHDTT